MNDTEGTTAMNMLNIPFAHAVVKDRERDLQRVAGHGRPRRSTGRWRERQRR